MDNKNFLKTMFEFLGSDTGETLEELKAELKEEGIDFNLAQNRLASMIKNLGKVCDWCEKPKHKTDSNNICYCKDKY